MIRGKIKNEWEVLLESFIEVRNGRAVERIRSEFGPQTHYTDKGNEGSYGNAENAAYGDAFHDEFLRAGIDHHGGNGMLTL